MTESVQFWLDNKMSAGIKVAAIGDQLLVIYREKFYVVEKEAAHTKGGKTVRYSKSSLPAIWKKALRGETLSAETLLIPADDALPLSTITKRKRTKIITAQMPEIPTTAVQSNISDQPPAKISTTNGIKPLANQKKTEIKLITQTTIVTTCPHCNYKHELPIDKGKNGKPFFMVCIRCKADFAVRFVPVMMYQAQVAGFN